MRLPSQEDPVIAERLVEQPVVRVWTWSGLMGCWVSSPSRSSRPDSRLRWMSIWAPKTVRKRQRRLHGVLYAGKPNWHLLDQIQP